MLKIQISILCVILCTYESSCFFDNIFKLGRNIWKSSQHLANAESGTSAYVNVFEILTGDQDSSLEKIKAGISELSSKIDKMSKSINENLAGIKRILGGMKYELSINNQRTIYRDYIKNINHFHRKLLEYVEEGAGKKVWANFALDATQEVEKYIVSLSSLLVAEQSDDIGGRGFVYLIADQGKALRNELCEATQTVQYQLANLLERVILTEVKVLHILGTSYRVLYPSEEHWQRETERAVKRFESRYANYLTAFIEAMGIAPGFLRACDPPNAHWSKDENYFEIRALDYHHFLQTFDIRTFPKCPEIANEEDCVGTPGPCMSTISLKVCEIQNEKYLWVKTDTNTYGQNPSTCPGTEIDRNISGADKLFMTNCICRCFYHSTAHYISLAVSRANVAQNKVIIGARLVQKNRILHIQVKQGTLLAVGKIDVDPESQSWVELPTNPEARAITRNFRTFILNNPVLPIGYVLVGVQFLATANISLRVIGKKWDFINGTLQPGLLQISTKPHDKYGKLQYTRHSSIYAKNVTHTPNSQKHWIELEGSELKYDVGQSTVPHFDGIAVVTDAPSPLGGIGLYHKHVENFAGFISLQLHSLPYKDYFVQMLRKYKPGSVLDECNDRSCTPDEIVDLAEKLHSFMERVAETEHFHDMRTNPQLVDEFNEIEKRLESLQYYMGMDDLIAAIRNVIDISLPAELVSWARKRHPMSVAEEIDQEYNRFLTYFNGPSNSSYEFQPNMNDTQILQAIDDLRIFLVTSSINSALDGGFIEAISNAMMSANQCKDSQSSQHILAQIFRTVVVTEVKAMSILTFTYRIQSVHMEDWEVQLLRTRIAFKNQFVGYIEAFAKAMNRVPGDIRACDPERAAIARDKTYIEMEGLGRRVYFYYERTLGFDLMCMSVVERKNYKWYDDRDKCDGQITDCYPVKGIHICRKENSSNSYEWIKGGTKPMKNSKCRNGTIEFHVSEEDNHCICSCSGVAESYISLSPVLTNLTDNMVLTGLRFVHQNQTLHIQMKQGKLLQNGWVDPTSQGWMELPEKPEVERISATQRKFFLEDVIFPPEYAVVGLQFVEGDGFFIRVTAQKFDFSTGMLLPNKITKFTEHINHKQLQFTGKNSVFARTENLPDSKNNWIELKISESIKDVGQTVLPLFDGIPVEVEPPTPIGGIGIYHKGAKGFAGYISLKLHSLQFKQTLNDFIKKHKHGHTFADV